MLTQRVCRCVQMADAKEGGEMNDVHEDEQKNIQLRAEQLIAPYQAVIRAAVAQGGGLLLKVITLPTTFASSVSTRCVHNPFNLADPAAVRMVEAATVACLVASTAGVVEQHGADILEVSVTPA